MEAGCRVGNMEAGCRVGNMEAGCRVGNMEAGCRVGNMEGKDEQTSQRQRHRKHVGSREEHE